MRGNGQPYRLPVFALIRKDLLLCIYHIRLLYIYIYAQ